MSSKETKWQLLQDRIYDSMGHCQDVHDRWRDNFGYFTGDSIWSELVRKELQKKSRGTPHGNLVAPTVMLLSGREQTQRVRAVIKARERGDEAAAAIQDKVYEWNREMVSAPHYESLALRDAFIGGLGAVSRSWDNLGPAMRYVHQPIIDLIWDHTCRDQNLRDREWHVLGKWIRKDRFEHQFGHIPGAKKVLSEIKSADMPQHESLKSWPWTHLRDGKFYDSGAREVFLAEEESKEILPRRLVAYRLDTSPPQVVYDQEVVLDGQTDPFLAAKKAQRDLSEILVGLEAEGIQSHVDMIPQEVVVCRIWAGEELLEERVRPHFLVDFMTGISVPVNDHTGLWTFWGLVDWAKEDQVVVSKLLEAQLLDLMTRPKGAIVDASKFDGGREEVLNQLSSPLRIAFTRPGVSAAEAIQEFGGGERANWSASTDTITQLLHVTMGVPPFELAAQQDIRRISGQVTSHLTANTQARHATFYDALRAHRRQDALTVSRALLAPGMLTDEEIQRIVGEEAWTAAMQSQSDFRDDAKFDVEIEDVPVTGTERQDWWRQLMSNEHGGAALLIEQLGMPFFIENNPMFTADQRVELMKHYESTQQAIAVLQAAGKTPEGQQVMPVLAQLLGQEDGMGLLMQALQMIGGQNGQQ